MMFTYILLVVLFFNVQAAQAKRIRSASFVNQTNVDLRVISASPQPVILFQHNTTANQLFIKSSRLHSNQLFNTSAFFNIQNATNDVIINSPLSRAQLCMNMKYCSKSSNEACMLSLTQILYLTNSSTASNYFNQLSLVKMNLLVASFVNDSLRFERDSYKFTLGPRSTGASLIGQVKATTRRNSDLDSLVRYSVEFDNSALRLLDLVNVDEKNGSLSVNLKRSDELNSYLSSKKSVRFYVNAMIQCSSNQKPMLNRTTVILSLDSSNKIAPKIQVGINMTSLIETRQLRLFNSPAQCLKLDTKSLLSGMRLAIAQIQLDNVDQEIDSKEFRFHSDLFSFEVQYLVDNMYVIYLVKSSRNLNIYLSSLHKIDIELFGSRLKTFYLCISDDINDLETNSNDPFYELNMLRFEHSLYSINVNEPKIIELNKLSSQPSSTIKYFIDNSNNNDDTGLEISVDQLNTTSNKELIRLNIKSTLNGLNVTGRVDNLQTELILIAYDPKLIRSLNVNIESAYDFLKSLATEKGKFLPFVTKLIISSQNETEVVDQSVDRQNNEFTFRVSSSTVKNSVIGHLPSIGELELANNEQLFANFDHNMQNFYYELNATNKCYRLDKYDGVLYYLANNSNCSHDLWVNLEHDSQSNLRIPSYFHIRVEQDNSLNTTNLDYTLSEDSFFVQGKPISELYVKYNQLLSSSQNVRVANLVRNFDQQVLGSIEYKTKFELSSSDIFQIDSRKSGLYVNPSKIESGSCHPLSFLAKNFIYLSWSKRKLISIDQMNLTICFIPDQGIKTIIEPVLDSASIANFQQLIKRTSSIGFLNTLFKENDPVSSFIWYLVIGLFAVGSLFLVSVLVYLNINKRMTDATPSKKHCICRNTSNMASNRSYSFSSSSSSSSNGFKPASQLEIRNDELYQIGSIVPNKLDMMFMHNQERVTSNTDLFDIKEESVSEDQGVYCVHTGLSSCSASPTDSIESNISSVTSDQQIVGIEKTKLSLFDLTPTISSNHLVPTKSRALAFNSPHIQTSDSRNWLIRSAVEHRFFNDSNQECII